MVVVRDLVHEVDELRLERRRLAGSVLGGGARVAVLLVLDDALPHLPRQVEPGKAGVPFLEQLQDAQGLPVVLEAPVVLHQLVHHPLAGVAEGRVPEVVAEDQALGELFVEPEGAGRAPADLRPLQAMGQARPVVVALVVHEDLGLVLEPAERRAVDDPVPVALVAGAQRILGLRIASATAARATHPVGSEEPIFSRLQRRPVDQTHRAHASEADSTAVDYAT